MPTEDFGKPSDPFRPQYKDGLNEDDMQWRNFMPPMATDHTDPEAEEEDTIDLDNPMADTTSKPWKREMSPQMAELEK